MVVIIENRKPILDKIKDFAFEHYIYTSIFVILFIILTYRFSNRKSRIMKRNIETMELKNRLQTILDEQNTYNNYHTYPAYKEFQNFPNKKNVFEYNPDITVDLDYTPAIHPDHHPYQDRPVTSYSNDISPLEQQFYIDNQQAIMDSYYYSG